MAFNTAQHIRTEPQTKPHKLKLISGISKQKNDRAPRHVTESPKHSPSLVHHLTSQHMYLHRLCTTSTSNAAATALLHRSQHAAAACQARSSAPPRRSAHHARTHAHKHTHTPYTARKHALYTARKREKRRASKSAPKHNNGGGMQKKAPRDSPAGVGGTPDLTCCSCVFCCGLEPAVAA